MALMKIVVPLVLTQYDFSTPWNTSFSENVEYNLDFLFFGNGEMHKLTKTDETKLFYQGSPVVQYDANAQDGSGLWVIREKDNLGYGSANPEDARNAAKILKDVGEGINNFYHDVL